MSRNWITAVGAAVAFVLAALVGVLGNQLTRDAVWAWVWFVAALAVGAAATVFFAVNDADPPTGPAVDPREARRLQYDAARAALAELADDFAAVYGWVVGHGEGARTDVVEVLVATRGPVLHTLSFGPLSRALDDSLAAASNAADAMERSGVVPERVVDSVCAFVLRVDWLHDRCKSGAVANPEHLEKWLADAEDARFVRYWDAVHAIRGDFDRDIPAAEA